MWIVDKGPFEKLKTNCQCSYMIRCGSRESVFAGINIKQINNCIQYVWFYSECKFMEKYGHVVTGNLARTHVVCWYTNRPLLVRCAPQWAFNSCLLHVYINDNVASKHIMIEKNSSNIWHPCGKHIKVYGVISTSVSFIAFNFTHHLLHKCSG